MEIGTKRLILRSFVHDDFLALRELDTNPLVQEHRGNRIISVDETRHVLQERIELAQEDQPYRYPFAIVLRTEACMIGECSLKITQKEWREASLSYTLKPQYWNNGYMTEAAAALLAFGFERLGFHRIWASCNPENIGSWRVMEKLGMRREGHLRSREWVNGTWQDHYVYAILEQEWNEMYTDGYC